MFSCCWCRIDNDGHDLLAMLLQVLHSDTVVPDTFISSSEPSRQCVSVSVLLQFEAKKRVSAEDAIRQSYFKSLGEEVQTLADSELLGSHDEPPLHL